MIAFLLPLSAVQATTPLPAHEVQRVLDAAMAAHRSQAPTSFTVEYFGEVPNPGQSLSARLPYPAYPMTAKLGIDDARSVEALEFRSELPGDFRFANRYVQVGADRFDVDLIIGIASDAPGPPPIISRFLPHRFIEAMRQAPDKITMTKLGDDYMFRFTPDHGIPLQVHVAVQDMRVRLVRQELPPGPFGKSMLEHRFVYALEEPGQLTPLAIGSTIMSEANGSVSYRMERVRRSEHLAYLPKELDKAGFAPRPVQARNPKGSFKLGDGVWLLQNVSNTQAQWSYNVLVVELDDSVLIAEAPLDDNVSAWVKKTARGLAGGKPIKYLIQSHHHQDHLGGIRSYARDGLTIVGTADIFVQLGRMQGASEGPWLAARQLVGSDNPVTIKRKLGPVEIHRLEGNPHSEEMLVVYLPGEKIIYQADLVNAGEYPPNAATYAFADWLKQKGIEPATIAGLHGSIVSGESLTTLLKPIR